MKPCGPAVRLLTLAGLLSGSPIALRAQTALPATDTALARAPRTTWVAALASACDTLVIDTTAWRQVTAPQSNVSLPLPQPLLKQGDILSGSFYDFAPREPVPRYALFEFDPVSVRLLLQHAAATVRCPASEQTSPTIWVFGFDSPSPSEPLIRGIWHVVGAWGYDSMRLYGLSRDLWGARAFVTGMRRGRVNLDSAANR